MKKMHKKIIAAISPIPLFFAITFCCCLDENASANEPHSDFSIEHHHASHELEKSDQSQHQHSDSGHECTCPKHLSFLSAQSAGITFETILSQMLAKNFMANLRIESIVSFASLSNQTHGPPSQNHLDQISLPIYIKISNLRI